MKQDNLPLDNFVSIYTLAGRIYARFFDQLYEADQDILDEPKFPLEPVDFCLENRDARFLILCISTELKKWVKREGSGLLWLMLTRAFIVVSE